MQSKDNSTRKAPRMAQKSATRADVATLDGAAATQTAAAKGKSYGVWRTFDHAAQPQQTLPHDELCLPRDEPATEGAEARAELAERIAPGTANEAPQEAATADEQPQAIPAGAGRPQETVEHLTYTLAMQDEAWAARRDSGVEAKPWPHPEEGGAPVALPVDCFPDTLRAWAMQRAEATGEPVDYSIFSAMGAAAAFIAPALRAQVDENWQEATNLAIAIIGGVSARKTPGLEAGFHWLTDEVEAEALRYEVEHKAWQQLQDDERKQTPEPRERCHVLTSGTAEGLHDDLHANPGLLFGPDELTSLLRLFEQKGKETLRADMLSYITGRRLPRKGARRMGNTQTLTRPALSVCSTIQAAKWKAFARGSGDGFVQRFIHVWPDDTPRRSRYGAKVDCAGMEEAFASFMRLQPNLTPEGARAAKLLHFDVTAGRRMVELSYQMRCEAYNEEKAGNVEYAGAIGKLPGHIVRLASHFATWTHAGEDIGALLLRGGLRVTGADLDRAEGLLPYLKNGAARVFGVVDGLPEDSRRALAALRRGAIPTDKAAGFTIRDAYSAMHCDKRRAEAALEALPHVRTSDGRSWWVQWQWYTENYAKNRPAKG